MALELMEWMDRVFGQADPSDYGRLTRLDGTCGRDPATLLRLIEVFENPATLLKPYSDEVLDQAFWDLSREAFSIAYDLRIDWALRHRWIGSFETLFRQLFAVRCTRTLVHCSEPGSPLNLACYMWFDFDCWKAIPDPLPRSPFDSAFLASMRSILGIDHIACQESALHGLGHWHRAHSGAVETIIDDFLKNQRHVPERLQGYARAARGGCVQ